MQTDSNESRFSRVVGKPLKQSAFFDSIVETMSKDSTHASPAAKPPIPIPTKASKGRILVADDVAVNQLLALKILEKLGYSAHAVANGKETLEALERVEYDLILMDCQMPEMDGFEASRLIRNHENKKIREIPIIALTANAMAGDDQVCFDAGMNDYLTKPIKKNALESKIEQWLKLTAA